MKYAILAAILLSAIITSHGQSRYPDGNSYDLRLNDLGNLWYYVQRVDAALDSLIRRTDSLKKRVTALEYDPFLHPGPGFWHDPYGHRFKISDTLYTINGQSYLPIFPETYADGWVAGAIDTVNDFEIHVPEFNPRFFDEIRPGEWPPHTESSIIPHSPDDNFEYSLPPLLSADSIKRKPSHYPTHKKRKK